MSLRYLLVAVSVLALASQGLAQSCSGWNSGEFFESATLEAVTDCLAAGASVNAQSWRGVTPLHYAALPSSTP